MIVNQDIKPEKQAYYLGSKVIEILKTWPHEKLETGEIFVEINKTTKVTYHAFTMAMTWLFLIGAVKQEKGEIIKCF